MIDDLDFTKDRPFIEFSNEYLNSLSDDCFINNNLNLEIATLFKITNMEFMLAKPLKT